MIRTLVIALSLVAALPAGADSFRCGTRIVVTGDTVVRLVKACGQPGLKYKARETIGNRGGTRRESVTNWVYERGRKRDMIVSVRDGRVVKITVE